MDAGAPVPAPAPGGNGNGKGMGVPVALAAMAEPVLSGPALARADGPVGGSTFLIVRSAFATPEAAGSVATSTSTGSDAGGLDAHAARSRSPATRGA